MDESVVVVLGRKFGKTHHGPGGSVVGIVLNPGFQSRDGVQVAGAGVRLHGLLPQFVRRCWPVPGSARSGMQRVKSDNSLFSLGFFWREFLGRRKFLCGAFFLAGGLQALSQRAVCGQRIRGEPNGLFRRVDGF